MVKKVAAINDLSGLGKCSLTVAIPILSALGVQACPLPTAVLSNQTEYPQFYIRDFTEDMTQIINQWSALDFSFEGIYTGFLSHEKQVAVIEGVITRFKKEDTLLLVDPVMGDNGKVYPNFSADLIERIIELAFKGDVITPNLTEACILLGEDYQKLIKLEGSEAYLQKIAEIGERLLKGNVCKAVITGIRHQSSEDAKEMFYNFAVEKKKTGAVQSVFVKRPIIGGSFSGTGDILASIICGMLLRDKDFFTAVEAATDFIALCVRDTVKYNTDRNDGVNFEKYIKVLASI